MLGYNFNDWNAEILLSPQSEDLDAIVTLDSYDSGVLILDGALTSSGNYNTAYPQFIIWDCTGDESSNTLTITGMDAAMRTYTISATGANSDSVIIEIPFINIQAGGIILENDSDDTISVGISSQTATPWIPFDRLRDQFNAIMTCTVSDEAALTYSVEVTEDNALTMVPENIQPDTTIQDETESAITSFPYATKFLRTRISAWTSGSLLNQFVQTGRNPNAKNY